MLDNKAKFTEIYDAFARRIFAFAYNRIGNQYDSEDVMAETFAAVWANIENFPALNSQNSPKGPDNGGDACKRLCYTIARNKINDILRERYRLPVFAADVEIDQLPEYSSLSSERNPSANNMIKRQLGELVKGLSERDKLFYRLRIQQSYKLSEEAKELNLSLNNTKVIQNRLIKKLKKLWETQTTK